MRSTTSGIVTALLGAILIAAPANASHNVSWEGFTWDHFGGGDLQVLGDELHVTSQSPYTAAYYDTDTAFRADDGTSVTTTFIEQGYGTVGAQLWVEREGSGSHGSWTQLGAFESRGDTYWLVEWNPGTNALVFYDTGVERTPGEHTLEIGLPPGGGQYDYWIDGQWVYTSTVINPDYIGDVYLAGGTLPDQTGRTQVFTSYSENRDYAGVVGPPTSRDDCQKDGWQSFNNPSFDNQGQCVAYVASGGKNRP